MKNVYMQQGDVILYHETSIPKKAKEIKINNEFILEHGEGIHKHRLVPKSGMLQEQVCISETEDKIYLEIKDNGLLLVHEEHGTSQIEPNLILSKVKEREWDYEVQEARNVLD